MNDASTVSTIELIENLARDLARILSDADVDFTAFPSGSGMLDVRRDERLFVMSYFPERGFGVDEVRDGEGFQVGYRFAFDEFEPAAVQLRKLVAGEVTVSGD